MPRIIISNIDYIVTVDLVVGSFAAARWSSKMTALPRSARLLNSPANPGDDVIDGRGKLALPGVFDTHVHNSQQLGRSCGDEAYSGPERLFRRLWPVEAHMDKGDALCAARLAQLEMIRAGTTCFADPGSYPASKRHRLSKRAVCAG